MKRVLVGLAGLILFALLSVDIYLRLQPHRQAPAATPSPSPSAPPAPTATPMETAALTPIGTPAPVVQVEEVQVAPTPVVVANAKPPVPAPPAPKPTRAATRRPAARPRPVPPASSKPDVDRTVPARGFVTGETTFTTGSTSVDTGSAPPDAPRGFDPGGVEVKAAPKVPASIEFDVFPKTIRPGDPYTVRIFVRNQGKKVIKIRELRVASTLNGARSEAAVTPKLKDIPPELSALVAEIPSVWRPDVHAWTLEVALRSAHGDVYKNTVSWR